MRIILALLCSLSLCCGQQIIDSYRFAAAAGVLLLDESGMSGATGAYSLRKLRAAYAGSAIRVRRSNDNAETDIGFTGNALNTAALATHVGANSGFVVTWYDQSGNGRNITHATAASQPTIVNAGTIVTGSGGGPAIDFPGTQYLEGTTISNFISNSAFTSFGIFNADTTSNVGNIYDNDAIWADFTGYVGLHLKSTTLQQFNYAGGVQVASTTIATGTWYLAQSRHESGSVYVKVNAASEASGGSGNTDNLASALRIGVRGGTEFFDGKMHEVILYNTALSSGVRTTAVANINAYYAIY